MDTAIRKAQLKVLDIFSKTETDFALSAGTALELYYLKHRFSADLDFFSPKYNLKEIDNIISLFKAGFGKRRVNLESEFMAAGRAQVKFYTISAGNLKRPLKIDFVEDVLFAQPVIKRFNGVPVYSAENIYLQKIAAISGTRLQTDDIGREVMQGRREARDVFDIYMLSRKIKALHIFLKGVSPQLQRGMVHWYRAFSRQDVKLSLLDLDIYDKKFNAKEMIIYLEDEIKQFIARVLE